jgi:two-component system chemotaxis response regulator CheB
VSALPAQNQPRRIRVVIVDDSAVIRGLVTRWIEAEPDLEMVGVGVNGRDGVERVRTLKPDVVILDIEMPVLDGVSALPEILRAAPQARVVMASTLTQRGAEVTIRALAAGASDYLAKPDAGKLAGAADYKRDLLAKLRALGGRALRFGSAAHAPVLSAPQTSGAAPAFQPRPTPAAAPRLRPVTLRARPEAVFIGSSTGGPEALRHVVGGLARKIDVPVFITQHMPAMFTRILAEHLSKQTGAKVVEAVDGQIAEPGVFHIAPGDNHMLVTRKLGVTRIILNQNPPENFCRPAVDPLFRSAAETYGERALAVVLTGMGHDGREGARVLTGKGAMLIAQDEATSVVWGMPGAVTEAGLASAVKPIAGVAPAILDILRGAAP